MQANSENIVFLFIAAMAGAGLLAVSIILLQIRSRNRLLLQQRKLQEAELEHQKNLLHAVIRMQEEERTRIGRDLHDEVGTALSSLRMLIENYTEQTTEPAAQPFKKQSKQIIDRVITDTRNISHNLSPIAGGQYAFADALEDLCDQLNQPGKLGVLLNFDAAGAETRFKHDQAVALYRVLSELLNNTVKHAAARHIWIDFIQQGADKLKISYKDDGKGMPEAPQKKKGMGMGNMESRLGMMDAAYTITTAPGKGFLMEITMPLP